jgi:DNA-binding transcriptional MerR regulator
MHIMRLSTRDASEYLSLPESTLRYYRHIGTGPASYRMGRKVFYDVVDLDAWKHAQKAATLRGGVE